MGKTNESSSTWNVGAKLLNEYSVELEYFFILASEDLLRRAFTGDDPRFTNSDIALT
jgi:hypothetical protein